MVIMLFGFLIKGGGVSQNLVSPKEEDLPKPEATPSPTPVEFHFDKSTNLKMELEEVNPQVKDSDFQDLEKLIPSL